MLVLFCLFIRNEDSEMSAYLMSYSYSDSRISAFSLYLNHLVAPKFIVKILNLK